MMDEVRSVNGVPIRLSQERWLHIIEARDDLADRSADVLDVVQSPDWVTKGYRRSLVAWKGYGRAVTWLSSTKNLARTTAS